MNPEKILILTAIRQEAAAVASLLPHASVFTVGIGGINRPSQTLLDRADLIVVAGLGGGLDPVLAVGDVILDDPHNRFDWPGHQRGKIYTSTEVAGTPAEKARLYARSLARVVDMEQAVVEMWFPGPTIGIRAVSDTADECLDPRLLQLVDRFGRPKPLKVAKLLLRTPTVIPQLLRLNRNTNLALKNMSKAVSQIVGLLSHGQAST